MLVVSLYKEVVLKYVLFSFIAPSGPPVIVMSPTVSSRSITVNWNEIPCIQRNGRIIRYEVEFEPSGEGTTSMISGRSFTANGLTPFTNYTFQVRGVNSESPGPYSDLITITTSEGGNLIQLCMYVSLCFTPQLLVLCPTSLVHPHLLH